MIDQNNIIGIQGKYNAAIIYASSVEPDVIKQVQNLCNHPEFKDAKIRIMPDTHPGKSTVVGLTISNLYCVCPALLGPDIGCGVLCVPIEGKNKTDYAKLDKVVNEFIPAGSKHRKTISKFVTNKEKEDMKELVKLAKLRIVPETFLTALGTLGGGNHFISLEVNENKQHYLIIHTGSRSLGQAINIEFCKRAQAEGLYAHCGELKNLSYLTDSKSDYLTAVQLAQNFAELNRFIIAKTIMKEMNWKMAGPPIDAPHNFYTVQDAALVLRKGAIALGDKTKSIIPLNMADGSLIVKGSAQPEWNNSGPHGAGRLLGRSECGNLDMKEYKNRMKNIYSTSVKISTLDESPMAYKNPEEIKAMLHDVCTISEKLTPVYNFKAS